MIVMDVTITVTAITDEIVITDAVGAEEIVVATAAMTVETVEEIVVVTAAVTVGTVAEAEV
jgi:hypothetical protein